jgi:PAS domain S-box-containing protein
MEQLLLFSQNPALCQLVIDGLGDAYQVTAAASPDDLLASVDLVILDFPSLHSLAAALRARRQTESFLPVLLVAADPEEAGHDFCQDLMDEVILAPPRPSELRLRVSNLLARRRLQAELQAVRSAPEPLKFNEGDWERTFNAVPDLIAILDREYRLVRANRAMLAALGKEEAAMLGRKCYEVIHRMDEPPSFCPHSRVLAEGRECMVEVSELGRDFLVTAAPLTDSRGNVTGSVHLARDITQVKQVEKMLQRQAELLDLAYDAIIVWDLKDRVSYWNRAAAELYGWSEEDALKNNIHQLLKTEFPRSLEEIEKELLRNGRWEGELTQVTREGRRIIMASRWALHRGEGGEPVRVLEINTEITQRKLAEEMLKTQARVLESMAEGVAVASTEQIILFTNPAFDAMFGYQPGELCGQHARVLNTGTPEESSRQSEEIMQGLVATGFWSGEVSNRRKDGSQFVSWATITELEVVGKRCFVCVQADITGRKEAEAALQRAHDELEQRVEERTLELRCAVRQLQAEVQERLEAEQALRDSEERFRAFMRHQPGVATMRDKQGRYVFANEQWERVAGKTRQEWFGKTLDEVYSPEFAERFKARDRQIFETLKSFETLEIYPTGSGDATFLCNWFPILDHTGKADSVGLIAIDITARKQAENALAAERQRLFALLERLPAYVILRDAQRRMIFANGYFLERFGDFRGKTCYEIFHGRSLPCDPCPSAETFCNGRPQEWERRHHDNRYYQIYGYPFADIDGTPLVLEMGIDITARKQAEEALQESQDRLRDLTSRILTMQERERGQLSRELHEGLGQALLVFKMQLRAIERRLPQDWEELRADCRQGLKYLDEVVDDIRRLSHDLSPSVLENIGLSAAIQNLCDEFGKRHGLKTALDLDKIDGQLSPEAQINIYRIFQEALDNIGKYAGATAVNLSIKKNGDLLCFSIKDNGAGFAAPAARQAGAASRGFSLTAMEERVRMLGGGLQIKSAAGDGTDIIFSLPLKSS